MFPYDPPEIIRKPLVFCFLVDQKGTMGRKVVIFNIFIIFIVLILFLILSLLIRNEFKQINEFRFPLKL